MRAKYSGSRLWNAPVGASRRRPTLHSGRFRGETVAGIGNVGWRRRLPLRDSSGVSPDSMRPQQVIGGEPRPPPAGLASTDFIFLSGPFFRPAVLQPGTCG